MPGPKLHFIRPLSKRTVRPTPRLIWYLNPVETDTFFSHSGPKIFFDRRNDHWLFLIMATRYYCYYYYYYNYYNACSFCFLLGLLKSAATTSHDHRVPLFFRTIFTTFPTLLIFGSSFRENYYYYYLLLLLLFRDKKVLCFELFINSWALIKIHRYLIRSEKGPKTARGRKYV